MNLAIRKNNILASNLYWVSCLFALARIGLAVASKMEHEDYTTTMKLIGSGISMGMVAACCFLVGLGLRKGYMWVKILVLTMNIIGLLAYAASLPPNGLPSFKLNYDTPLEATLLILGYLVAIGFIVVIFRGFGLTDDASPSDPASPTTA